MPQQKPTQDRIYRIGVNPETGELDRERAVNLLADLEATLFAIGGSFVVGAVRESVGEASPGEFETTELVVKWSSYMPPRENVIAEPVPGEGDEIPPGGPETPAPAPAGDAPSA